MKQLPLERKGNVLCHGLDVDGLDVSNERAKA